MSGELALIYYINELIPITPRWSNASMTALGRREARRLGLSALAPTSCNFSGPSNRVTSYDPTETQPLCFPLAALSTRYVQSTEEREKLIREGFPAC